MQNAPSALFPLIYHSFCCYQALPKCFKSLLVPRSIQELAQQMGGWDVKDGSPNCSLSNCVIIWILRKAERGRCLWVFMHLNYRLSEGTREHNGQAAQMENGNRDGI